MKDQITRTIKTLRTKGIPPEEVSKIAKDFFDQENTFIPAITKKSNHKYESVWDWYNGENDYYELIENLRWTKTQMMELLKRDYPAESLMLFEYGMARVYDEKGIRNGNQQIFQFFNKQFDDDLEKLIRKLNPKLILDVCAGDGMLAKILSGRGFNIKATDDYSWPFEKRFFDVVDLDYKEAIEHYQPDMIIGCWMPLSSDWTPDFRKAKSVKHYLMIGEGDGGCTGGNWDEHKSWKKNDLYSAWGLARTDWIAGKGKNISKMLSHTCIDYYSRI